MNRRCLCVSRNHRRSLPPGGEGGTLVPDEGEIGEWNHRNIRSPSLPPGGEGGTPVPDEGEIGEWNHRNICSPCLPPGGGRKTASSLARQRRMRAKSASILTIILIFVSHRWRKEGCKQFGRQQAESRLGRRTCLTHTINQNTKNRSTTPKINLSKSSWNS